MERDTGRSASADLRDVNRRKLFLGSCIALIATAVAFAVVGAVTLALKREFVLTNAEVGLIIGAALWPFAVSQAIFAPLCDSLGFRFLVRLAFGAHLVGAALMILPGLAIGGFWVLFFGAIVIALGNGLVEAACNPLVATLYPEQKAVRLNQFHVWFPGGIVIGGVAAFLLSQLGVGAWEVTLALIFLPAVIYGVMMWGAHFPETENVQAGVSMGEMFRATFFSPLMWLLLFCMAITASTELGPNRWLPAVVEAGLAEISGGFVGIGILALAWINGVMAVMRYNSESTVGRFSPTLILLFSAIVSALGLYWLSYAETAVVIFLSATVFAVGVAYFWPTMLGFVSERIPRSGALGLGLMGGVGMAVVGLVTTPLMGEIADEQALEVVPVEQTATLLEETATTFPELAGQAEGETGENIRQAAAIAQEAFAAYQATGQLPEETTMNALRAVSSADVAVTTTGNEAARALVGQAGAILGPANNYGGRLSFRYIVPFTCVLIVIFGVLYWYDRRRGGYRARSIHDGVDGATVETAKADARATR